MKPTFLAFLSGGSFHSRLGTFHQLNNSGFSHQSTHMYTQPRQSIHRKIIYWANFRLSTCVLDYDTTNSPIQLNRWISSHIAIMLRDDAPSDRPLDFHHIDIANLSHPSRPFPPNSNQLCCVRTVCDGQNKCSAAPSGRVATLCGKWKCKCQQGVWKRERSKSEQVNWVALLLTICRNALVYSLRDHDTTTVEQNELKWSNRAEKKCYQA